MQIGHCFTLAEWLDIVNQVDQNLCNINVRPTFQQMGDPLHDPGLRLVMALNASYAATGEQSARDGTRLTRDARRSLQYHLAILGPVGSAKSDEISRLTQLQREANAGSA